MVDAAARVDAVVLDGCIFDIVGTADSCDDDNDNEDDEAAATTLPPRIVA